MYLLSQKYSSQMEINALFGWGKKLTKVNSMNNSQEIYYSIPIEKNVINSEYERLSKSSKTGAM